VEATSAPQPHGLRLPKPRRLLAALSDERLADYVRTGDVVAFEVLYDRYSAGILGFCRHMLGSLADAEDAVQHTFIAAHADIHRHGRRELHVKAWLYTIARNRCLSMLRARRELPSDDGVDVVSDRVVDDVVRRDDLRALLADVAKLPEDQREALVLAEIGDLSHSDISAVVGCEAAKVKSLVFQARTALLDRRIARETSCAEIREQIATLRGGALRRSHLRHHIEACPGCAHYREEIRRQRAMLALALPVVPSAALKAHVLGGLGIGTSSAAAGAGAGATATAGAGGSTLGVAAQAGIVAKFGVAAVLAVGGITGAAAVAEKGSIPLIHHSNSSHRQGGAASHSSNRSAAGSATAPAGAHSAGAAGGRAAAAASASSAHHSVAHGKHALKGSHRSASGSKHGFTPIPGESNGARARQFAQTRGKGNHTGLTKDHTVGHKRQHPTKKVHAKHVATPRVKAAPKGHAHPTRPIKPPPPAKEAAPKTGSAPTAAAPTQTTEQQAPATTPQTTITAGGTNGKSKSESTGKRNGNAAG
jgi:RNA polymerase sigma factor (sigma-70 family)